MKLLYCSIFDNIYYSHLSFLENIKKKDDTLTVIIHTNKYMSRHYYDSMTDIDKYNKLSSYFFIDKIKIDDSDYLVRDEYDIVYASGCTIESFYLSDIINKIIIPDGKEIIISSKPFVPNISPQISPTVIENLFDQGHLTPLNIDILEIYAMDIFSSLTKNSKILDIGSGLGGMLNQIKLRYGCTAIGVEPSQHMRILSSHRYSNLLIIPLNYFEFTTCLSYDIILCINVLNYFDNENKFKFLQKMRTQLSQSGRVIISDFICADNTTDKFNQYRISQDWYLSNKNTMNKLIKMSGFNCVSRRDITYLYILSLQNKYDLPQKLIDRFEFMNDNEISWYFFELEAV